MKDGPRDGQRGVSRYTKFHAFDPKRTGPFAESLSLPRDIGLAGKAIFTTYRSDKWEKGTPHNYIHEHEGGVHVYRPDIRSARIVVPVKFRNIETLVLLGKCLGVAYEDAGSGEEMIGLDHGGAELYCSPDGHCLYVVTDKRKLEAMIWGGKLRVLERGIVG